MIPKQAISLRNQARMLRERADQIDAEAFEIVERHSRLTLIKAEDRLINRKQALELLWFDSYPSLRRWERKMNPLGYLIFTDDKIMRSEVLRFIDDYPQIKKAHPGEGRL